MTALVYIVALGLALIVVVGIYGPWSKLPAKAKPLKPVIAAVVVTAAIALAALLAAAVQ